MTDIQRLLSFVLAVALIGGQIIAGMNAGAAFTAVAFLSGYALSRW